MRSSITTTRGLVARVLLVEQPPLQQRDLHRPEVVAADDALIGVDERLARRARPSFDGDRSPREHLAERQRRHAARGRRRPAALAAAPRAAGRSRARPAASLYFRPLIVSSSVSTLRRVEARRHLLEAREAANQQAGADQQHHRQRQLGDHEQAAHVRPAAPERARAGRAAAGVLEVVVQVERGPGAAPAPGRTACPTAARRASVNSSTPPSIAISCSRGTLFVPERAGCPARLQLREQQAERRRRPGRAARSRSAAGGRCGRGWRRAPRAPRSPSARASARDSSRLATLAQAISSTKPTGADQDQQRAPDVADDLLLQRHDAERQPAVGRIEVRDARGAAAP